MANVIIPFRIKEEDREMLRELLLDSGDESMAAWIRRTIRQEHKKLQRRNKK